MTNFESGKFIAQIYSHDINRLLKAIYQGTVESNKIINDFERGVIEEVISWINKDICGEETKLWLSKIT
jgi:uncharacterized membrane-anchored protein